MLTLTEQFSTDITPATFVTDVFNILIERGQQLQLNILKEKGLDNLHLGKILN